MGHPPMISPHHVGLHDVSQIPPIEFRPTEEDVAATDWETAEDGTASADALAEEHAALTDFIDANDAADLAQPTTDAPEER